MKLLSTLCVLTLLLLMNVLESDRDTSEVHFTFVETTSSSVTTSNYYLPESKIFKFGEFAEKVNEMQDHFKIMIDHFRNKSDIQIGKSKLTVNKRMAKVLGLLNLTRKGYVYTNVGRVALIF